ncbi:DUF1275 family protein [Sphingobium vermicomposti]|uniref:Uncharacterized membrane protein YoaK (UPF0700 family) n=1 Tax=Sphingobium vermicomposti TaxID=529005 RepID=A0A846M5K8_9SPHN|nr:YoaK family protein [Sphingobium vermicomposti]NIJ15364.1 uncharacterized membrane protein YoaK (UPF0700 family) [Sphingobium vermicomposti]
MEIARAERSLVPLARGLAALAGFFDAAGFLAFGRIYLASPVANTTILGVELAGVQSFQLAGTALLSFLVGVVLTTLCAHGLARWRRTAILSGAATATLIAFLFLEAGDIYPALILLAAAAGGLHCVLERDPQHLQEGMFPSAQMIRVGDALGSRWDRKKSSLIGDHSLFWLCFIVGGVLGTTAWLGTGQWALALASLGTGLLAVHVWSIERNLCVR